MWILCWLAWIRLYTTAHYSPTPHHSTAHTRAPTLTNVVYRCGLWEIRHGDQKRWPSITPPYNAAKTMIRSGKTIVVSKGEVHLWQCCTSILWRRTLRWIQNEETVLNPTIHSMAKCVFGLAIKRKIIVNWHYSKMDCEHQTPGKPHFFHPQPLDNPTAPHAQHRQQRLQISFSSYLYGFVDTVITTEQMMKMNIPVLGNRTARHATRGGHAPTMMPGDQLWVNLVPKTTTSRVHGRSDARTHPDLPTIFQYPQINL